MAQPLYHRLRGPTQTAEVAKLQEDSGELWGLAARWSHIPKVKAYVGPLPAGREGIEFTTEVPPDPGCPPGRAEWSGPRPGVMLDGEFAKIRVTVTRNTQEWRR
jgi:hypothetical protein